MKIALIGLGAIGSWLEARLDPKPVIIRRGDALPMADVVVEVAGHGALAQYGVAALKQGSDLVITSIGALADQALWLSLQQAATCSKILLPAGAVAGIDALAGIGFEKTEVRIIADPALTQNVHVLEATGNFGTFTMTIAGRPLPSNPKSSSLTAMSLLRCIENRQSAIVL